MSFPRITLPGVDVNPAVREALEEHAAQAEHVQRQKVGMVTAMMRLGRRPYLGTAKHRKKPTRHVRLMRRLAAVKDERRFSERFPQRQIIARQRLAMMRDRVPEEA